KKEEIILTCLKHKNPFRNGGANTASKGIIFLYFVTLWRRVLFNSLSTLFSDYPKNITLAETTKRVTHQFKVITHLSVPEKFIQTLIIQFPDQSSHLQLLGNLQYWLRPINCQYDHNH